jgi:hypothetical protein
MPEIENKRLKDKYHIVDMLFYGLIVSGMNLMFKLNTM